MQISPDYVYYDFTMVPERTEEQMNIDILITKRLLNWIVSDKRSFYNGYDGEESIAEAKDIIELSIENNKLEPVYCFASRYYGKCTCEQDYREYIKILDTHAVKNLRNIYKENMEYFGHMHTNLKFVPGFSSNINDAYYLVLLLQKQGYALTFHIKDKQTKALIYKSDVILHTGYGKTLPEAICAAIVKLLDRRKDVNGYGALTRYDDERDNGHRMII